MILFILISFALSATITFIVRNLALRYKIVNAPNKIVEQHKKPIAYLGGVAIFISISLNFGFLFFYDPEVLDPQLEHPLIKYVLGLLSFLVIGVIDDLRPFSPRVKLALQLLVAVVMTLWGIVLNLFGIPILDLFFSTFLIVLFVNAVNLTDVCDGLVATIIAFSLLILGIYFNGLNGIFFVLSAAYLGFLVFNSPQASIFMGDAGSHLSGFLLFSICHLLFKDLEPVNGWLMLFGLPALFILELVLLVYIRKKKGLKWWLGSPDHFSLRYQKIGVSRWKIDLVASFLNGGLLLFALIFKANEYHGWISGLILLFVLTFFWRRTVSIDMG